MKMNCRKLAQKAFDYHITYNLIRKQSLNQGRRLPYQGAQTQFQCITSQEQKLNGFVLTSIALERF